MSGSNERGGAISSLEVANGERACQLGWCGDHTICYSLTLSDRPTVLAGRLLGLGMEILARPGVCRSSPEMRSWRCTDQSTPC